MVNSMKLKGKIAEQGKTIQELAREIGIHPVSLSSKIKSGKFGIAEVEAISEELNLSRVDIMDIFFAR